MAFLAARIHNFASARDRKEIDVMLKQNSHFYNIYKNVEGQNLPHIYIVQSSKMEFRYPNREQSLPNFFSSVFP